MSRFLRNLLLAPVLACAASPVAAQTFVPNVEGTGQPGIDGGTMMIWNAPQNFDPTTSLRVDRHMNSGSGQMWGTYHAIWALGSTNPNNSGFEWVLTGELHNNALASTGAQNVAVNGTAFKESNGIGPVGPTWAGNFNCSDTTGEEDPIASCIGAEIDVSTTAKGTDSHRQRVGIQISMSGTNGAHSGYGIMMGTPAGGWIDRGIGFLGQGGQFQIGLDTTQAYFSKAAIMMAPNQFFAVDGDNDGNFKHFWDFDNTALRYLTPGGAMFSVRDDGLVEVGRIANTIPHVPTSSFGACTKGEQAYNAGYFFQCVDTNHWKRAALSDF